MIGLLACLPPAIVTLRLARRRRAQRLAEARRPLANRFYEPKG